MPLRSPQWAEKRSALLEQRFKTSLSSSVPSSSYLVPANTTWNQILDYVSGTGQGWPLDFYQPALTRDTAVSFATLNRAITVLAGGISGLICGAGNLSVIDARGRPVTSRRADRVLEVLQESADGGNTSSVNFIEDCVADYGLDGNALLGFDMSMDGMLNRLQRYSPWDNDVTYTRAGSMMYRLVRVDASYLTENLDASEIIHVRWPRLLRYDESRSTREGLAMSPVIAMRPALDIGLQGDRYIREWFTRGAHSRLHVDFKTPDGMPQMTPEHREQLRAWIVENTASRSPLVTFNGTSSMISDTPQDAEAANLREFQVMEVARVYGIPAPLIGSMVTEWGPAIEQLAKLWWRFGLRQHLARFLAPFELRLLRRGQRFHVDVTDLLRGDADAISKMVMAIQGDAQRDPIATRQELRHQAGLMAEDERTEAARVQEIQDKKAAAMPEPEPEPPPGPESEPIPPDQRVQREIRCQSCNRMLGKTKLAIDLEIKCPKCGKVNK